MIADVVVLGPLPSLDRSKFARSLVPGTCIVLPHGVVPAYWHVDVPRDEFMLIVSVRREEPRPGCEFGRAEVHMLGRDTNVSIKHRFFWFDP